MRISDWSSDVCSSDLPSECPAQLFVAVRPRLRRHPPEDPRSRRAAAGLPGAGRRGARRPRPDQPLRHRIARPDRLPGDSRGSRSEEHTSELQSLMRISYAVFCLKKQITKLHNQITHSYTTSCTVSLIS